MPDAVEQPFSRFEIGIAEIDAQHRRLFELLAEIRSWSGTTLEIEASVNILNALTDYAQIHFTVEESLMRMHRYPDTARHVAEHQRFITTLDIMRHRLLKEGRNIDLVDFIKTWLIDHIDRVDRQYVEHFLKTPIDPAAGPPTAA